jgi:hypothetical protein
MNARSPPATPLSPAFEREPLALRPSRELGELSAQTLARGPVHEDTFADHFGRALNDSPAWVLIALAALATAGWIVERRRRRKLETEKDSVLWADVQPPGSSIITGGGLPSGDPAAAPDGPASASASTLAGTPGSRREATLIDLHQLDRKLWRRRARGDLLAAALLLQQHLAEFRFTSPWVFLELRELEHLLGRGQEWELARAAFLARFGQRAPMWQAPSTADAELVRDALIAQELVPHWPYRGARMVIRRWVLGEPEAASVEQPVPILALGVYRDLLFLDRVLDAVMISLPEPADSLL